MSKVMEPERIAISINLACALGCACSSVSIGSTPISSSRMPPISAAPPPCARPAVNDSKHSWITFPSKRCSRPPCRRQLSRGGPKYKIEARSFGKRSEVPVSREERNASVDTALGDQRVPEARLATFCQNRHSQPSCPLRISRSDLDQRDFWK